MKIQYRKATLENLYEIMELIKSAIINMNQAKIYQWDEIYPDEATIKYDIENNDLFIGIVDGKIAVIYVINNSCDKEYNNGDWQYPDTEYRIIHRLCVHPDFQNNGIGKITMEYIESKLSKAGIESIRLDAFNKNSYALKLYKNLGYKIVGYADWRMGRFYLMEKFLAGNLLWTYEEPLTKWIQLRLFYYYLMSEFAV